MHKTINAIGCSSWIDPAFAASNIGYHNAYQLTYVEYRNNKWVSDMGVLSLRQLMKVDNIHLIFNDSDGDECIFACTEKEFVDRFLQVSEFRYIIGEAIKVEYTDDNGNVSHIELEKQFNDAIKRLV